MITPTTENLKENARGFFAYLDNLQDGTVLFEDMDAILFLKEDLPTMNPEDWEEILSSYIENLKEKLLLTNVCPECGETIHLQTEIHNHPWGDTTSREEVRYYQCEAGHIF